MQNTPLGDATLFLNEDCNLVVDQIGGSGQGGVIQTGLRSVYMKTSLATPNFSASLAGTSLRIRQLGIVDDEQDQEIMLTQIINFNDEDISHSISCSEILVEGYRVHIYNQWNQLVTSQEHGVNPPILIYPKTDLLSIACGIWPNGDVYTVFELASPQPILLQTSPVDPGPFTGSLVFVEALSAQRVPTLQNSIENVFFATGPVTLTSMEAGSLPGDGAPCSGEADASRLGRFAWAGWKALVTCAIRGVPQCPAPCPGFPTLSASELSPACYDVASGYLEEIASSAFRNTWGPDRCPLLLADRCDRERSQSVGLLFLDQVFLQTSDDTVATGPLGDSSGFADGSECDLTFPDTIYALVQILLASYTGTR